MRNSCISIDKEKSSVASAIPSSTPTTSAPLDGSEEPAVLVDSPGADELPRLSPDGNLLAYTSDETGRFEVYVRSFP